MTNLNALEINPSKETLRSIIWLHGLGADGHDFAPIVPQLGIQESHQIRFIFPHAPSIPVTVNGNLKMPAWYDIYEVNIDAKIDLAGIASSKTAIESLIEHEISRGMPSKNIILAGFSQGAAMALTIGLQYHEPLGGIIALSGYLPNANNVLAHIAAANQQCPIFLAHGTSDPIVAYSMAETTRDLLVKAKLPVSWHSYYMPHSVCEEEVRDIGKWAINLYTLQATYK